MKSCPSPLALIAALLACSVVLTSQAHGQAMTVLHVFNYPTDRSDGYNASGSLAQGADGYFYGETQGGGIYGQGTVFKISPQGNFTVLHNFAYQSTEAFDPEDGLVEAKDGSFYGTTLYGGGTDINENYLGNGTVFRITPSGQYSIIHTFGRDPATDLNGNSVTDGGEPQAALTLGSDGYLYGTTNIGGTANLGTMFRMTPQGAVTILHNFADGSVPGDGAYPVGKMIQASDGNFYGTCLTQGGYGGTLFKITPQGQMTLVYNFNSLAGGGSKTYGNLVQATDGYLYGTTWAQPGNIFKTDLQGNLSYIYNFDTGKLLYDGYGPDSGLLLASDGNFYGMTVSGGTAQKGMLYELTPQGVISVVHNFGDGTVPNDGTPASAPGSLIQGSNSCLYGVTTTTVFKVQLGLPAFTSPLSASAAVSVPFVYPITATNYPTAYAAPNLPAGLTLDPTTGVISGVPTTAGTSTVTLTATNSLGSNSVMLTITVAAAPVPVISSSPAAFAVAGAAFSYSITATNNPTSYNVTGLDGTGLQFDSTSGLISGTPTTTGTITAVLTAANSIGTGPGLTLTITVTTNPATIDQQFVILHNFGDGSTPNDGANPQAIIQGFDGTFYGVTQSGGIGDGTGSYEDGTVFDLTASGTDSILTSFSATSGVDSPLGILQASDGSFCVAAQNGSLAGALARVTLQARLSLIAPNPTTQTITTPIQGADGNFYCLAKSVAALLLKVNPDGQVTILHTFDGGQNPNAGLVQDADGNIYGTSVYAGTQANGQYPQGAGVVFKITPQGQYTNLHICADGSVAQDAVFPIGGLIQGPDGAFYGFSQEGGANREGTIFRVTPQGVMTIVFSFPSTVTPEGTPLLGYDGNFYGTVETGGGSPGQGIVYQVTTSGVLTILHTFGSIANDGKYPVGNLVQGTDGNIYGVTSVGGSAGKGTAYAILAHLTPTHAPIFYGSAYGTSAYNGSFSFTPKTLFGVGGFGAQASGIFAELGAMLKAIIHPATSATNWTLAGTLPNYLAFNSATGAITGTPVQGGTYTVVLTPHNAIGDGLPTTVTLYIDVPPNISSAGIAAGNAFTPFSYAITGQPDASSYSATNLPAWLNVDTGTGLVTGTPPGPGTFVYNTIATNYAGTGMKPVVLTVTGGSSTAPVITSATAINGTAGTPLTYQIVASGQPIGYSALVLPVGLTFDPIAGLISGTPTTAGTFSVPISATNATDTTSSEITFTIAPTGAPTLPATLYATTAPNVAFSYHIPATGLVGLYNSSPLPAGLTLDPVAGIISGTPTATGLSTVTVSALNGTGSATSTLNLNVVNITPTPFSSWATAHSLSAQASPNDTPQGDGVPNLLKYLYNLDPTKRVSPADLAVMPHVGIDSTGSPGSQFLTLTYRQYAAITGISVNLQASSDLINWSSVTPDVNRQVGVDAGTGDPIVETGVKTTGTQPQYIRLNVTPP